MSCCNLVVCSSSNGRGVVSHDLMLLLGSSWESCKVARVRKLFMLNVKVKTVKMLTCLHPTNALYVGSFCDILTQLAMKTVIKAIGEIYFQQINQNTFGLLPVMYSMSFAKLKTYQARNYYVIS